MTNRKQYKWSQWTASGLIRCGFNDYATIRGWISEFGLEAKDSLFQQDKPHAVYGRAIRSKGAGIEEFRLYSAPYAYMTDDELEAVSRENPHDLFYVAHK